MRYNIELLKEEADVRDVANAIGMQTRKRGSAIFTECVNEEHIEGSEFEHAVLYEKHFHCFSCGADYDCIEMVRHYYAKNISPITFQDACKIIAEIYGENFEDDNVPINKFPLTQEECRIIGLASSNDWVASFSGEECPKMNLKILFREDPEAFKFLVSSKAGEFQERYEQMADLLTGEEGVAPAIKAGAEKNARICKSICAKFGQRKKTVPRLYA